MNRKLGLIPLTLTVFFCVSGGPNGLEDLIGIAGPGMSLILILLTPLVWALPAAMMTAELSSAIPVEGGYYVWVKRAMGPFAGFLCGWWTWTYSWIDTALYPALFRDLVREGVRHWSGTDPFVAAPWLRYLLPFAVILPLTWVNLRGAVRVGAASLIFFVVVLAPYLVLIVLGLAAIPQRGIPELFPANVSWVGTMGSGLMVVMWNYLGWDSLATVAEEVDQPARAFPRAMVIGVPLVTGIYVLVTLAGLVVAPQWSKWTDGYWPVVGSYAGGAWLFALLFIASLVSYAGLFNGTLLAASRIPFVMARDGYFPDWLVRSDPKSGAPRNAILLCAVIYSIFAQWDFRELVELDVVLYSSALALELIALAVLRKREPGLARPCRVPGGSIGVGMVVALPIALCLCATFVAYREQTTEHGPQALILMLLMLAAGPVAYVLARARGQRPKSNESSISKPVDR